MRFILLLLCSVMFSLWAADPYPLVDAVEARARDGLPNVAQKIAEGKPITVAYLGGSITAAPGWRVKSLAWLNKQYPKATFTEVHAAIGGTGSDLGVYRLGFDVLRHKPDLLFVEFAVNDGGADPLQIHRCMEGIVRQTWTANAATDICYVYTLTGDMVKDLTNGKYPRAASAMEAVANHYGIPSIHFGVEVTKQVNAGSLIFKADKPEDKSEPLKTDGKIIFSHDNVHPIDAGHAIYSDVLARQLTILLSQPVKNGKPAAKAHALGAPLVADHYQQAGMFPLTNVTLSPEWTQLGANDKIVKSFGNRMPSIYRADKAGAKMSFRFKGTAVSLYDLLGPDCGQVSIVVDGGKPRIVARIDGYCTYHRISRLGIAADLPDGEHTVEITIDAGIPDKEKILFEKNRPDLEKNPEKYTGTAWYVGGVMVLGELIK